jgi:hypothetical protein
VPRNCNWNCLPCCPAAAIARGRHAVIDHLSVANALRLSVFALFAQVEVEECPRGTTTRFLFCTVPVQAAELPTEMANVISSKFGNRLRIVSIARSSALQL